MKNQHLLLSVDQSESSQRAVRYIADFFGGLSGFRVTLYHLIPVPEEDFFTSIEEQTQWIEKQKAENQERLTDYCRVLLQAGFNEKAVDTDISVVKNLSISAAILNKKKELEVDTVVVGRHGISREEEFLAGSTSNELLHAMTDNSALWIIE